jgi:hypothetical protein
MSGERKLARVRATGRASPAFFLDIEWVFSIEG